VIPFGWREEFGKFQVALPPPVDIDMTRGRGKGKIDVETIASQILIGIAKGRAEINMVAMALLRRILRLSLACASGS